MIKTLTLISLILFVNVSFTVAQLSKNTDLINIGNKIVDMSKLDKNNQIVLPDEKIYLDNKYSCIKKSKIKASVKRDKFIIYTNYIGENEGAYYSEVAVCDRNDKQYFKKELGKKVFGNADFLRDDDYVLIQTEPIFEPGTLQIYDISGKIIFKDEGDIYHYDIFPSRGSIMYINHKGKYFLIKYTLCNNNKTVLKQFDYPGTHIKISQNEDYIIKTNGSIHSYKSNDKLVWEKEIISPSYDLSKDGKYLVYMLSPSTIVLVKNTNGMIVWTKDKIIWKDIVYQGCNLKFDENNNIELYVKEFCNKEFKRGYIVKAILDIKGNVIDFQEIKK